MSKTRTTIEELFVQIFERKRWIVDQVKQQSASYEQYLASNCLINGIQPPSCLLTGDRNTQFRGLPFLPPRPKNLSAATNKPPFSGTNHQDADTLVTSTSSLDKCCLDVGGDSLILLSDFPVSQTRLDTTSSPEAAPELNHAISSPISAPLKVQGTNLNLDQSLARIQRSKSRQKALQLRNSGVKSAKQPTEENHTTTFSGIITSSTTSGRHSKRTKALSDQHNFSNTSDGGCIRIAGSTSGNSQLNSIDKPLQHLNLVDGENGLFKGQDGDSFFTSPDLGQKDKQLGTNTEEKISGKVHMTNESCRRVMMPQTSQVDCAKESLQLDKSEEHQSGRAVIHSKPSASNNNFSQLDARPDVDEGHDLVQASEAHLVAVLDNDLNDTIYLERCDVGITENDFISGLPAEACSNCLRSNLVSSFGVEGFSVSSPPDVDIVVEPKQLFFDDEDRMLNRTPTQLDGGDSILNGKCTPCTEKEKGNMSSASPSESLREVAVHNNFCEKDNTRLRRNKRNFQVPNSGEKLRASPDACEEDRFGFLGPGKSKHNFYLTCSRESPTISDVLVRKGPTETEEFILADALPKSREIPKQGTVNSLKDFGSSSNTCAKIGSAVDLELQEREKALGSVDTEEEPSASLRSCAEARLEFREGGTHCNFCPALSSDEILNGSTLSSWKGPSETVEDVLADVSSECYKILKQEALEPPKTFVISNNTPASTEALEREEERRASYESCKDMKLEFTEEGAGCHLRAALSSSEIFDASTLSSRKLASQVLKQGKGTPESQGTVVVGTSSGKNTIPETGSASSDHLMSLKVGTNSSAGGKLLGSVDPMEVDLSDTSDQNLDLGADELLGEHRNLVSISDGLEKSLSHGLDPVTRFSRHNEHEFLSRELEKEYVAAAGGGNRSVLTQAMTPKSAQISSTRQEFPPLVSSCPGHDINDGFSRSEESPSVAKFINSKKTVNNASVGSWPPYKRRKVEAQSSNVFTTPPRSMRVEPPHQIVERGISKFRRHVHGLAAALECKHVTSSSDMRATQSDIIEQLAPGLCRSVKRHRMDKSVSSPSLQAIEGDGDMKGGEKDTNSINGFRQPWIGTLVSNREERESASALSGLTDISLTQLVSEVHQNVPFHQSKLNLRLVEEISSTEATLQNMESVNGEQLLPYCTVRSPNDEGLGLIVGNESMPELEGFSIDLSAEHELSPSSDGLCLSNMDLPTTTSERISFLEKLCRSTSKLTPLPQSSKHKIHRIQDAYQSLPNGLLERIDLRNAHQLSDEDFEGLKASCNFISSNSDLASYSGCMPTSHVQLDFGVRKPPDTPPPVRMLGQEMAQVPAHQSFERQQSVNPELSCFHIDRIDEDSDPSEDQIFSDEVVDTFHKGISPGESNSSSLRRPLVDMTNNKALPSPSVTKNVHDRSSVDSVNTGPYMHRSKISDKQKPRNTYGSNKIAKKDKRSNSSSTGGNDVGMASKPLHNMSPKLSRITREGSKSQGFSDKGYTRANIVSSVPSFIPFVQQKQQRAVAAGKRDVKVKALEAAEAAKRLEEKRENNRRMKKEAAKLERARLEEEKNKQLALKQKMSEEEQKKKEGDMAARKRLREEKDKKEKERKRKCNEEARRQPKEQDRLLAEREEIEQRHRDGDEREGKRNGFLNEEQNYHKAEKGSQVVESKIKVETVPKVAVEDTKKVGHDLCEENYSDFPFSEASGDRSYEISPYQASDNEEEEEDAMPNKKFAPSWTREEYLASILPRMQQVDPYKVFPSTRVCNICQVLLPRVRSK